MKKLTAGERRLMICVATLGRDGVVRYSNHREYNESEFLICSSCHKIYHEPSIPETFKEDYVCKRCEEHASIY
jgi:hypothetical protein